MIEMALICQKVEVDENGANSLELWSCKVASLELKPCWFWPPQGWTSLDPDNLITYNVLATRSRQETIACSPIEKDSFQQKRP